MLFSIASVTYTLSCPLTGILAKRSRLGPRRVIVTGLVLQLVGFLLIGPSPILRTGAPVPVPAPVPAPVPVPVPVLVPVPVPFPYPYSSHDQENRRDLFCNGLD